MSQEKVLIVIIIIGFALELAACRPEKEKPIPVMFTRTAPACFVETDFRALQMLLELGNWKEAENMFKSGLCKFYLYGTKGELLRMCRGGIAVIRLENQCVVFTARDNIQIIGVRRREIQKV